MPGQYAGTAASRPAPARTTPPSPSSSPTTDKRQPTMRFKHSSQTASLFVRARGRGGGPEHCISSASEHTRHSRFAADSPSWYLGRRGGLGRRETARVRQGNSVSQPRRLPHQQRRQGQLREGHHASGPSHLFARLHVVVDQEHWGAVLGRPRVLLPPPGLPTARRGVQYLLNPGPSILVVASHRAASHVHWRTVNARENLEVVGGSNRHPVGRRRRGTDEPSPPHTNHASFLRHVRGRVHVPRVLRL